MRRTVALLLSLALAAALRAERAPAQQEIEKAPVPYVPTSMQTVSAMLALARVGPDDVVYDLGSGDGRVVVTAASRHGARGVGFEIDPALFALSRANADSAGVRDRVRFESSDLFEADLSEASVVTLYLSPLFNIQLRPKLLSQLRPGSRVVSHDFHMAEWRPDSVVHVRKGFAQTSVYLWIVPARVDGFWYLEVDGGRSYALELRQSFQRLAGAARADGREIPLEGASIRGDSIAFVVPDVVGGRREPLRFSGSASDRELRGTVEIPGLGTRGWRAIRFTDPEMAPL